MESMTTLVYNKNISDSLQPKVVIRPKAGSAPWETEKAWALTVAHCWLSFLVSSFLRIMLSILLFDKSAN